MDLEITERQSLPHLDREELTATVNFSGPTPSRVDIRNELASAAKAKEDLIVVRQIKPVFGETQVKVMARVYENEESLQSVEGDYMHERHAVEESEEPAEEEPAEESESGDEEASEDEEPEGSEESEESEDEEPEEEEGDESEEVEGESEESDEDEEEKEAEG